MLDRQLMESTLEDITMLRNELREAGEKTPLDAPRYESLLNLRHYLALRSKDRTPLQEKLFLMSLSSLGRSYAHVAASIDTLYDQLASSLSKEQISPEETAALKHLSIDKAIETASKNSKALFGGRASAKLSRQNTAIMVTLPSHAADNGGELIVALAQSGVNVFRINTAHDTPNEWRAMAEVIAIVNASRSESEKIKIFVDLAGPKIRTGKINEVDLPVEIGSNKREKKVLLVSGDALTRSETLDTRTLEKLPAQLALTPKFYKKLQKGDRLKIVDAYGKKVSLWVEKIEENYCEALIERKVFVDKKTTISRKSTASTIENIPTQVEVIRLFRGDRLVISEEESLGHAARLDKEGNVVENALIGCSFKGVLERVSVGESIFIDDGKIGVEVVAKEKNTLVCKVTQAKAGGVVLKEEKGINFPQTAINTPALTRSDRENVLEVLDFADNLSLSFCQSAEDVKALQNLLAEHKRADIGIIAKIETKQALVNIVQIVEALLACEKSGVMIARGDLAIEVGFANLASVQEMLLDLCDAAHLPVIWATQVLESQMKNNLPSRAEVTDAAMAGRAECVMLNKGAFATDTIKVLLYILEEIHLQFKKNSRLLRKETFFS